MSDANRCRVVMTCEVFLTCNIQLDIVTYNSYHNLLFLAITHKIVLFIQSSIVPVKKSEGNNTIVSSFPLGYHCRLDHLFGLEIYKLLH